MSRRIALGVQYNGQPWLGWQSQPGGRTIQDTLEAALSQFSASTVGVSCAGRTDTGVHALGQVVHFDTTAVRTEHGWVRGTNSLLPPSIAVTWAKEVNRQFHARYSAVRRTYHYVLYVHANRSAHVVGRVGWTRRPLNIDLMRHAAESLIGEKDFSALRSSQCQAKSPVRNIDRIDIVNYGAYWVVTVRANGFLHHMMRNLMGCLLTVGSGKCPPEWLADVLASRNRALAAPTFMADGLYLGQVDYPQEFQLGASCSLDTAFPGLLECAGHH